MATSPGASFTCRRIEGWAERVNGATASGCRYAFRLNSCVRFGRDATPCLRPNSEVFWGGATSPRTPRCFRRERRDHIENRLRGHMVHGSTLGSPTRASGLLEIQPLLEQGPVILPFIARRGSGRGARFISSGTSHMRAGRRRNLAGWAATRKRHGRGCRTPHGGRPCARGLGRTRNTR